MLTSEETLLGGRPQLVVPLYLEHLFTARALERLGVGRLLAASSPPEAMTAAITAARGDPAAWRAARAFASAPRQAPDPARLLEAAI
jgi:UDP:flavonoid glycosyltransferase YjiC (YdhE family)